MEQQINRFFSKRPGSASFKDTIPVENRSAAPNQAGVVPYMQYSTAMLGGIPKNWGAGRFTDLFCRTNLGILCEFVFESTNTYHSINKLKHNLPDFIANQNNLH